MVLKTPAEKKRAPDPIRGPLTQNFQLFIVSFLLTS
jgi:hypothetical protein